MIAKQDSKSRGFKIKSLVRKEEFDLRGSELVPWLRHEIRARHNREGMVDTPKLSKHSSQHNLATSNERVDDVRILVSQHKNRKTNRKNIVESGELFSLNAYES